MSGRSKGTLVSAAAVCYLAASLAARPDAVAFAIGLVLGIGLSLRLTLWSPSFDLKDDYIALLFPLVAMLTLIILREGFSVSLSAAAGISIVLAIRYWFKFTRGDYA